MPVLAAEWTGVGEGALGVDTLLIGPGVRSGMPILMDNPREVGPDRIVNAVAALARAGGPCIVVDFGTSTNFDAVSAAASTSAACSRRASRSRWRRSSTAPRGSRASSSSRRRP